MTKIKKDVLKRQIRKNEDEAEALINDYDKLDEFLTRLENKLSEIPNAGNKLSKVPVMISLVRAFARNEYTVPSFATVVKIVSALIYLLSPVDLIPDAIPGLGYIDDVAVIALCLKKVDDDLEKYEQWRNKNKAA